MKVVLDIETIQAPRDEWARLLGKQPDPCEERVAGEGLDLFAAGAASAQREIEDELYAKSSFDGTFSRIVCIGLLEFSDQMEPRSAVAWYGGNERELLRQFWARIAQDRPTLYITHNGLGFDLPFIKKRSMIQQVRPTVDINLAKFRTEPVYDTMAIWSNWDTRGWGLGMGIVTARSVPSARREIARASSAPRRSGMSVASGAPAVTR